MSAIASNTSHAAGVAQVESPGVSTQRPPRRSCGVIGAPSGSGKSYFIAQCATTNPTLHSRLIDGDELIQRAFGWPEHPDWWRDSTLVHQIETRNLAFLEEYAQKHAKIILYNSPRAAICVLPDEEVHRARLTARSASEVGARFPGVDIIPGARKRYAHAQFRSIEEAVQHMIEIEERNNSSTTSTHEQTYRGLVNQPHTQVREAIRGFLLSHPHCCQLELEGAGKGDIKVVRCRELVSDVVCLLSGGGAGHDPAHLGFLGRGMLTAVVTGEVFASPSVQAILAGIRCCVTSKNSPGVLLIVKNYTGDRLNFGLAMTQARLENIPVEMVIVGDDVTLPRSKGVTGRRGLAGTILVHKIAGAAVSERCSLEEVRRRAELVAKNMVSLGVAISEAHVPGSMVGEETRVKPGWMEIGMGIHNEPGYEQLPLQPAHLIVKRMIDQLLSRESERDYFWRYSDSDTPRPAEKGIEIVLMINNLGAATPTEMSIFTSEAVRLLTDASHGFIIRRLLVGTFMTALDMKGISITIMRLDPNEKGWQLDALDQPTNATGWPKAIIADPKFPDPLQLPTDSATTATSVFLDSSTSDLLLALSSCILTNVSRLNELDRLCGDGDCGTTLALGAQRIQEFIKQHPAGTSSSSSSSTGSSRNEPPSGPSIFISNIPYNWTDSDLMQLFSPFGNIAQARILSDNNTGKSKGYGVIHYDSTVAASNAIATYHQKKPPNCDNTLQVRYAFPKRGDSSNPSQPSAAQMPMMMQPSSTSSTGVNFSQLFLFLARLLGESMGGSSGALIQILFTAAAGAASSSSATPTPTSSSTSALPPLSPSRLLEFVTAFEAGIAAITRFGGAQEGDRTMLDALIPAIRAMRSKLESSPTSSHPTVLTAAATAARAGADRTRDLQARAGRASYLSSSSAPDAFSQPDPGAEAVALLFQTAARQLSS